MELMAVKDKRKAFEKRNKWIKPLYEKLDLLAVQNEVVGAEVIPTSEDQKEARNILDRGILFESMGQLRKGLPNRPHKNSADLYLHLNKDEVRVATGYALGEDNLWRQHSWVVMANRENVDEGVAQGWEVVETVNEYKKYFGYILTHDETEEFLEMNIA